MRRELGKNVDNPYIIYYNYIGPGEHRIHFGLEVASSALVRICFHTEGYLFPQKRGDFPNSF